ncbi:MAG: hypothetical protein ACOC1X_00210 [Promethearchaeota archaeon]
MAEEKVTNIWEEMKVEKENLGDKIKIKMNDKEFDVGIKFVDFDKTQEINEEYEDKKPSKPVIKLENGKEIRVPSEKEKYQAFNDHPKAKKYQREIKPIEKERIFRLAYEFIEDDMKPSDDPEEGTEILMEAMRYSDAIKTVNKGTSLMNLSNQVDEAKNDS